MKIQIIASIALAATIAGGSGIAVAGDRHDDHRYRDSARQHPDHWRDRDQHQYRQYRDRDTLESRRYRYQRWVSWHRYQHVQRRHHRHHDWQHLHRHAHVTYEHRRPVYLSVHDHHAAPAVAGAIIGGALANHVSYGDPGATIAGAMMGAVIAGNRR